ncbi:MAG TPA: hypothetical protein VLE47_01790 [Candidatus Saccharimonadales bacterium]|nr:hypothetical protein [Candidatus Saccharimonadales bacterium]
MNHLTKTVPVFGGGDAAAVHHLAKNRRAILGICPLANDREAVDCTNGRIVAMPISVHRHSTLTFLVD